MMKAYYGLYAGIVPASVFMQIRASQLTILK